jgi:bifunctional DNA-binding transcriptional regulator/antitoxin component of YhaV-PrlF toxin-antitoxin module
MTDGKESNITTVQGGQKSRSFVTAIPKQIAEALGISKGTTLEWIIDRGDLVVRKVQLSNQR